MGSKDYENLKVLNQKNKKFLRDKFMEEGSFENFEFKQIVEFLLYYSVHSRKVNVSELAEKLLNEFGSFNMLLDLRAEDVMRICDVSEVTAVLIAMLPSVFRKYLQSKQDKNTVINSPSIAYKYFEPLFIGRRIECFYIICLDKNKKLIKTQNITEGNSQEIHIYVDKIAEVARRYNSKFVLVGHNHPGGTNKPSDPDILTTISIIEALDVFKINLLDHIIVYDDKYFSFAKAKLCGFRLTPEGIYKEKKYKK